MQDSHKRIAVGGLLAAAGLWAAQGGTAGKFLPGVYSDAEKEMLAQAAQGGPPGGPPGGKGPGGPGGAGDSLGHRPPPGGQGAPQTSTDAPMAMAADAASMRLHANAFDYWNPLYNDEEYAKKSRYKGLIALPFFKEPGGMFPTLGPRPEIGRWNGTNDGGEVEFFLPVRPGDVFRSEQEKPGIRDVTPAAGSDTRTFEVSGSATLYNQKGEKVMRGTMLGRNMFTRGEDNGQGPGGGPGMPPPGGQGGPGQEGGPGGMSAGQAPPDSLGRKQGQAPDGKPEVAGRGGAPRDSAGRGGPGGAPGGMPDMGKRHVYTAADWEKIHAIEKSEVVRGAKVRSWEEVKVGESPAWTVVGPTTTMDMIQCFGMQVIQGPPMREQLRNKDRLVGLKQDKYGVYHLMEEGHFSEAGMGGNMPIFYMAFGRSLMVRLVTNWMGDDGWLAKFAWRNGSLADSLIAQVPSLKGRHVTGHGKVGDVLIAKAWVTRVYQEAGVGKVDMVTWTEDFDGTLCQAAVATVILPRRK